MDFKATSSNAVFYIGESNGSTYECQSRVVMPPHQNKGVATYYTNGSQSVTGRVNNTAYSLDTSKWYHLKVTRIGNVLTAQILDGDTVIATATDNNVTGTTGNVSWHNYVQTGTMYWKNILFIRL